MPPCQVHNVYSQPFAQACNLNGHHFSGFTTQPHTQITPPPHAHHQHFQHIAQQVGDRVDFFLRGFFNFIFITL